MSATTYYLKPAAADPDHCRGTKVRLCPFPRSQRGSGKRYLHPDGEEVVCHTGEERRWWLSMLRSGDVLRMSEDEQKKLESAAKKRNAALEKRQKLQASLASAKTDEQKAKLQTQLAELEVPAASGPWAGPDPVDRGSENVPDLVDAGPATSKKGGK